MWFRPVLGLLSLLKCCICLSRHWQCDVGDVSVYGWATWQVQPFFLGVISFLGKNICADFIYLNRKTNWCITKSPNIAWLQHALGVCVETDALYCHRYGFGWRAKETKAFPWEQLSVYNLFKASRQDSRVQDTLFTWKNDLPKCWSIVTTSIPHLWNILSAL